MLDRIIVDTPPREGPLLVPAHRCAEFAHLLDASLGKPRQGLARPSHRKRARDAVDVATERCAREDVELAGATIPRGALVLVAILW